VNLGLRVLERMPDGYHRIETVFHTIGLKDRIHIEEKESGIEVVCLTPGFPQGRENLAFLAANQTLETCASKIGVRVEIEKKIPAGAGLGGASSNAASTMVGINELFSLGLSESELFSVARGIGSDVPFFLKGGAALATGRGDELEHLSTALKLDLVIVFPGFPVLTKWAYGAVNSRLTPESFDIKIVAGALVRGDLSSLCRTLYNSFEDVVFKRHPGLHEIKKKMIEMGALGSLLSGSGSSVFCITKDESSAHEIAAEFKKQNLEVWETTTC
jgi:4-diphosphocytidyl-2-C-methyl-D-erythritol kinase